jgi:hypothetical protein
VLEKKGGEATMIEALEAITAYLHRFSIQTSVEKKPVTEVTPPPKIPIDGQLPTEGEITEKVVDMCDKTG